MWWICQCLRCCGLFKRLLYTAYFRLSSIIAKCFVFMHKKKSFAVNIKERCDRRNYGPREMCTLPPDEAAAVAGLSICQCNFGSWHSFWNPFPHSGGNSSPSETALTPRCILYIGEFPWRLSSPVCVFPGSPLQLQGTLPGSKKKLW